MKILILGYPETGKSEAARILSVYLGCKYANTSDQLIEELAMISGVTPDIINANKNDWRMRLFDYGRSKQTDNPLWPQDLQIKWADILTGLRSPDEVRAARKAELYDVIIWIHRPGYMPKGETKIGPSCADIVLCNDGTIEDLRSKLITIVESMRWGQVIPNEADNLVV